MIEPATLLRRGVDWLEARAPRAVWMIGPCVAGFHAWRFLPPGDPWAIPAYAAGGLLILLAMAALRYRVPDAAFTLVVILVALSAFGVMQGEYNLARVMCGGALVVLLLVSVAAIEQPMDKALAFGQAMTLLGWFAGNVNRGAFGPEVARSALGQAWGPLAEAALVLVVLAGYVWYNRRANTSS